MVRRKVIRGAMEKESAIMANSDTGTGMWKCTAGEMQHFLRFLGRYFSAEDIRNVDDLAAKAMHQAYRRHQTEDDLRKVAEDLKRKLPSDFGAVDMKQFVPGKDNVFRISQDYDVVDPQAFVRPSSANCNCEPSSRELTMWLTRLPQEVADNPEAIRSWAGKYCYRSATCLEVERFVRWFKDVGRIQHDWFHLVDYISCFCMCGATEDWSLRSGEYAVRFSFDEMRAGRVSLRRHDTFLLFVRG